MARAPKVECEVTIRDCPCGQLHCFDVGHYDKVLVDCGRPYWALQPKRNGPLVMFPWPGDNLTARDLAEREAWLDGTPYLGAQNI